jgi:hypothetical protein
MKGRLGNMAKMVTKRERPKGQRYALAIEGDEDVCKVVEGDREWSGVELASWPVSGLLCCPEAMCRGGDK